MADLVIYTTPKVSQVRLVVDNGSVYFGEPASLNGRDDAHLIHLPDTLASIGALLEVSADGYVLFSNRGILMVSPGGWDTTFQLDDVHLQAKDSAAPEPEPEPPPVVDWSDPLTVILWVYEDTHADLSTHEGCGKFTEDCCKVLHNNNSPLWGHIRKNPGQNQYNGHAVDAIMLLAFSGSTPAGIYDIIHDSVSPTASPSFNYKGEPDNNLWYYPPANVGRMRKDPDWR